MPSPLEQNQKHLIKPLQYAEILVPEFTYQEMVNLGRTAEFWQKLATRLIRAWEYNDPAGAIVFCHEYAEDLINQQ